MQPPPRYKAFMSYSHAADARLAPAVQRGLHRLGKKLWQLRALRVFRDQTSLSATPELWPSIRAALESSEHFLLLASPEAAASKWVGDEVECWLERHGGKPKNFFLVLTEGDLDWDDAANDFRSGGRDPVPKALRGRFDSEPLWVDLSWARSDEELTLRNNRFRGAILDLAAPMHGKAKDRLDGDDVRRQRIEKLVATAAFTAVVLAATVATLQYFEARRQRDTAELERDRAVVAQQAEKEARIEAEEARELEERARRAEAEQRREAEHQRNVALARALVSEAEAEFDERPLAALRTGLEGLVRAPAAEPRLAAGLRRRLAALARLGRLAKLSDEVTRVAYEPPFPYLVLINRYRASPLLRAADLARLAEYESIDREKPIRLSLDGRFFVVSQEEQSVFRLAYDIRRTDTGGSLVAGQSSRVQSLWENTLFPAPAPRYAWLDQGLSGVLVRLADGKELGQRGFDNARLVYRPGDPHFALVYRDDENTRRPPPPELFDLATGESLGRAPDSLLTEGPPPSRPWSSVGLRPLAQPAAADATPADTPEVDELFFVHEVTDGEDSDSELVRSELRRVADDRVLFSRDEAEIHSLRSDPAATLVAFNWTDVEDDSDAGGFVIESASGDVVWRGRPWRRIHFDPATPPRYFILDFRGGRTEAAPESIIHGVRPAEPVAGLGGAARSIEFRRTKRGYFVARLEDQTTTLWSADYRPRRLLDLGSGVTGEVELPNERLLVWYESGDAYLLDLEWLAAMEGRAGQLDAEALAALLCGRPLAGGLFDLRRWREESTVDEPLACRARGSAPAIAAAEPAR